MFSLSATLVVNLSGFQQNLSVNVTSPGSVTFYPQGGFSYENRKPYKIEYDFGDGSPKQSIFLAASPGNINSQAYWPNEPLDPRNQPVTHVYKLSGGFSASQLFNTKIKYFYFSNPEEANDSLTFNVNVRVYRPSLKALNFFEDFHLISTQMFGPENTMLYNFESFNPTYLLPVIVDWKSRSL